MSNVTLHLVWGHLSTKKQCYGSLYNTFESTFHTCKGRLDDFNLLVSTVQCSINGYTEQDGMAHIYKVCRKFTYIIKMCPIRTRCRVNQEKFHFGKCLVVGIIVAHSTHVGLVCSDHSTLTSVYYLCSAEYTQRTGRAKN